MPKVFLKRGAIYSQTEGDFTIMDSLDKGIYQIHQNPQTGELFLEKIADEFIFGFKLYGVDSKLVNHVIDTYHKQPVKKNIGVLLNGAKGTGKTVTAKLMANELGLPVLLCDRPYGGLELFLAGISQDCVFLFDEFEKNFRMDCGIEENCTGETLLSIMDGVYNTEHCHVFILTTNTLSVNDNLLCRPSRIRYLKSFGEVIDRAVLEEYVYDNLVKKEYAEEIMDFVDTLEIATIDIVKSIVEEINLHDTHIDEFKAFFNVKEASYTYYLRTWVYDKACESEYSKEQFMKAINLPYGSEEADFRPPYNSMTIRKPFNRLRVNEFLGNSDWVIDEIDYELGYMRCHEDGRKDRLKHFYIENPEAKPSLYTGARRSTYGYDDYCDY